MAGTLPLVLASLSMAASAEPSPQTRPYDGTLEATMSEGSVDVAATPTEPDPTEPAAGAGVPGPDPTIQTPEVALPAEPTLRARAVPRILTTMYGWFPGEVARHTNAKGTVTFTPGVQARAAVGSVSEFSLDDAGNRYDEGAHMFGRVRWNPTLTLGKKQNLSIVGMIDFANGRWVPTRSGNPVVQELLNDGEPPQSYGMYIVDPRELYLQWTTKYGQLRVGQMAFNWGLGLIANDGNNMDRFGDMKFGDDGIGSIQERILFATKPLARAGGPGKDLIIGLAADLVYRDPLADLTKGDLAGQGVVFVRWEPTDRPGNWIGAYAAYRRQKSASDGDITPGDDDLEVGVIDISGQGFRHVRDRLAILGAFEAVAVAGRSTFARGEIDRHRVLQAAAAIRAYVGNPERWLVGADGGFATGDANPDDDELNDFEAAPGFTAGLLMFQYYRGWQSARTEIRAEDPELAGVPPNGTQYLPTRGTVTNTVYIQPKARFAFREYFELWGGPLIAGSAVPLVDAYTTRLQGGSPHNSLGGRTGSRRYLGTELDVGVRGRYGFENLWVQAGLQGGIMFPGGAFEDGGGDRDKPIYGGWFRAELRY